MAVRRLSDEQPASFQFTGENLAWAKGKIADYPRGRQSSAVIPLLWKAQAQHHGWLPEPAIRVVADMLDMPYIRVFEIATFYTMFQLKPVGSVAHIGVCGTTPCMLRGSDDLVAICKERIAPTPFELSDDGRFSWEEVECAGACVNAPMVQIGPETYEDLTAETFNKLLDDLGAGGKPKPGPQSDRKASEPITGATTLLSPEKDERPSGSAVGDPDALPESDVDPEVDEAAEENAARPDPRARVSVEASRTSDSGRTDPSPVAPEPKTSGQIEEGSATPEREKAADESARRAEPAPQDRTASDADRSHDGDGAGDGAGDAEASARDASADRDVPSRDEASGSDDDDTPSRPVAARAAPTSAPAAPVTSQEAKEPGERTSAADGDGDGGEDAGRRGADEGEGPDRGDAGTQSRQAASEDATADRDGALADQVGETPGPEGEGGNVESTGEAPSDDEPDASFMADENIADRSDTKDSASAAEDAGTRDDDSGADEEPTAAFAERSSSDDPSEADQDADERGADPDDGAAPDSEAAGRADKIGTRPSAMRREDVDKPDDLRRISGIGPVIEKTLHDLGIFKFNQIAEWDQANKDWVNEYLAFKGRIDRENWVEQAQVIVNEANDAG